MPAGTLRLTVVFPERGLNVGPVAQSPKSIVRSVTPVDDVVSANPEKARVCFAAS